MNTDTVTNGEFHPIPIQHFKRLFFGVLRGVFLAQTTGRATAGEDRRTMRIFDS
jgi:hypothetical protein